MSKPGLFHAVFSRLIESFAPHVNKVLQDFEMKQNLNDMNSSILLIENMFESFPRSLVQYKNFINTLKTVAETDPPGILDNICLIFKELLKTGTSTIFSPLQNLSPIYKHDNQLHQAIFLYFGLFCTTDLICQILVYTNASSMSPDIIKCGYKLLETQNPQNKKLYHKLIDQWAVIFSIMSETLFETTASMFNHFALTNNVRTVFQLFKFIRLDLNEVHATPFLNQVIQVLRNLQKKKQLSSDILHFVSFMVITILHQEEQLQALFDIAWAAKDMKNLKIGAFELITALFPRIKKIAPRKIAFYKQRVFAHVSSDEKVSRSLFMFRRSIFGLEIDPKWVFWEWGSPRASSFCFVHWNSDPTKDQSDPESFSQLFMHSFFLKSNFSVCPNMFSDVLIHLASLDFTYFVKDILPEFIKLDTKDPRLITLLMTVPLINSEEYKLNTFQEISAPNLAKFNSIIRLKVLANVSVLKAATSEHGLCIFDANNYIINEADQKISNLLTEWKVTQFGELTVEFIKSNRGTTTFDLNIQLTKSMGHVFIADDLQSNELMNLLLNLSFNKNAYIATSALAICREKLTFPPYQKQFALVIIAYLGNVPTSEAMLVCLSLLLDLLSKGTNFEQNMIFDIELTTMIAMQSVHPAIRQIANKILGQVDFLLGNKGSLHYIYKHVTEMNQIVKEKLFCHISDSKKISMPRGEISYDSVVYSHYYDLWLYYVAEIANVLVAVNYTPLLQRFSDSLTKYLVALSTGSEGYSPSFIGILIFYYASQYQSEILKKTNIIYENIKMYEPYCENSEDSRPVATSIFENMLTAGDGWQDQMAFNLLQHIHVSLYPTVFNIISPLLKPHQLSDASTAMIKMVKSPNLTKEFRKLILPQMLSLLSQMQGYIIHIGANGPRVIKWKSDNEEIVSRNLTLSINYCILISSYFGQMEEEINEQFWPISSREVVFRFLNNWAMTDTATLKTLRNAAREAISSIVKTGPLFSDSLLFDESTINLFASIDHNGMKVLKYLLAFHLDLIIEPFIEACYNQPRKYADLFFDSLFTIMNEKNCDIIYDTSGNLLLLGLIYKQQENPKVDAFLHQLVDLIFVAKNYNETPDYTISSMPRQFSYAGESILECAMSILTMKHAHISMKAVVESIRPWVRSLRLLPKQTSCIPGTPREFKRFTPYQFLERLMKTTELVSDDEFTHVASLWSELLKCTDHNELIPLFIVDWKNPDIKQKLFMRLILTDTQNVIKRLALHCSFAYYFHITTCLGRNFDHELWVVPLLTQAFKKESNELNEHISTVIHYAFLFADSGAEPLLKCLCKNFEIAFPEGELDAEALKSIVPLFAQKLEELSEDYVVNWGREAIRWLLGCQSLKFAHHSLMIFNFLMKPIEKLVVPGVCKSVVYHMINSHDEDLLIDFVRESFTFYSNIFTGNEMYVITYATAFLDCKMFVDSCLEDASPIFIKSLSSPITNNESWANIIGIVRPLIPHLETNVTSQKFLELIINTSNSEELMMITSPLKEIYPSLFKSTVGMMRLMALASETALCKALSHYASMVETASQPLLNQIFIISSNIVLKVVNENNRSPLIKLYNAALNNLTTCPNAIEFVCNVSKVEPSVVSNNVMEVFYDWDRSVDDVIRALSRLIVNEESIITLTDCNSLSHVYNLLNCDVVPKILPFATQREMIEGMIRVISAVKSKRSMSIRRWSHGPYPYASTNKEDDSIPAPITPNIEFDFQPLTKPTELMVNNKCFNSLWNSSLVMSCKEFLSYDFNNSRGT